MTYPQKLIADAVDVYGAPIANRPAELAFYIALAFIIGAALYVVTGWVALSALVVAAVGGAATLFLVFSRRIGVVSLERHLKAHLMEFSGVSYAPLPPEPVFFNSLRTFKMVGPEPAAVSDGVMAATPRGEFQLFRRANSGPDPFAEREHGERGAARKGKPSGRARRAKFAMQACARIELERPADGFMVLGTEGWAVRRVVKAADYFEEGLAEGAARVSGRPMHFASNAANGALSPSQREVAERVFGLHQALGGDAFVAVARKSPKETSGRTEVLLVSRLDAAEPRISSLDALEAFARRTVEQDLRILDSMLALLNLAEERNI